jgi:hypothetical protein
MKKPVNSLGDRMDDFDWVVVSRSEGEKPKPKPEKPAPKKK